MSVPCKNKGPPLIISQKFTVHSHVFLGRESRDGDGEYSGEACDADEHPAILEILIIKRFHPVDGDTQDSWWLFIEHGFMQDRVMAGTWIQLRRFPGSRTFEHKGTASDYTSLPYGYEDHFN